MLKNIWLMEVLMKAKTDVGAVYYDWSEKAVYNLKKLITNCDAEIVISSDWKRTRTLEELKLLFRMHGLDEYITDMTSYTDSSFKNQGVYAPTEKR